MENLLGMDLANDMEDMLKIFLDDDLSEFYYYKENGQWCYRLK
jgi:8-oxo-dGTP diphosphatase